MHCKECKYVKALQTRRENKRYQCFCDHPDKKYIANYFKENCIQKMVGFISFSEPFITKPTIKTSPQWCPLKKELLMKGSDK